MLDALRQELGDPQVTAEYVRTYHEERRSLAAKSVRQHKTLQKRIDGLKREIDRLVDGIAKGIGDPAILGARATRWSKPSSRSSPSPCTRLSSPATSSSCATSGKRSMAASPQAMRKVDMSCGN